METHFRHYIENKKGYCDFLSHNSDIFLQNCDLMSHNCEFISHNYEKKSHNCEIKCYNYLSIFLFRGGNAVPYVLIPLLIRCTKTMLILITVIQKNALLIC